MKQTRDAAALAASLTNAANASLPLPESATAPVVSMPQPTETAAPTEISPPKKSPKVKVMADTVAMTLRPTRELLNDYTLAAAERTREKGRVVSAQEIMLEVLERGRRKMQK